MAACLFFLDSSSTRARNCLDSEESAGSSKSCLVKVRVGRWHRTTYWVSDRPASSSYSSVLLPTRAGSDFRTLGLLFLTCFAATGSSGTKSSSLDCSSNPVESGASPLMDANVLRCFSLPVGRAPTPNQHPCTFSFQENKIVELANGRTYCPTCACSLVWPW